MSTIKAPAHVEIDQIRDTDVNTGPVRQACTPRGTTGAVPAPGIVADLVKLNGGEPECAREDVFGRIIGLEPGTDDDVWRN